MGTSAFLIVGYIAGALAGVLLIASVLLFFRLSIHEVIGDLSGHNAKKGIDEINKNAASDDGVRRRRKIAERNPSGSHGSVQQAVIPGTERYVTDSLEGNDAGYQGDSPTSLLNKRPTDEISSAGATDPGASGQRGNELVYAVPPGFSLREEIIFINTNESIA